MHKERTQTMINYIDAFLSIQKVKKDLKTMTFEDAKDLICGYNETADSFEFNRGNVCGSVYNENNKPVLKGESCFSVYDSEHTKNGIAFHGTESEIYQKAREALIDEMRSYILADYHPTNAKEFEILGRALCGCNGVTILDDGGVMNGYGYTRRRSYSNADWRAIELIDESIRHLKK